MTDTYTVVRATDIHVPAAAVYPLIADFQHWRTWSPFERLDPGMERTYAGPHTGAGSTYAWAGRRRAGAGRMEMIEAVEPTRVVVVRRTTRPRRSESTSTFTLTESAGVTTVAWSSTGATTLWSTVRGTVFKKSLDDRLGPVFEKGLVGLRKAAESG